MTIDETIQRLENTANELQNAFGTQMGVLANNAVAMIRDRITMTGINAEGIAYANILTQTARPHTDYTKSYKRFKMGLVKHKPTTKNTNKTNKYHGFVDFAFSGQMWKDITVIKAKSDLDKGIATIGTNSQDSLTKLESNTKQRGSILDLSKDEIDFLADELHDLVKLTFIKNGL
jgi:hypothetical protein